MTEILLEVKGLHASYGHAEVLFGIDLTLRRGEVVALMGRNGAGKSTTLKAIMGLVQGRADTVTFQGHDIAGLTPFRIARLGLGYVPEERRIFTDLTVLENLEAGRRAARPGLSPWTLEAIYAIFPNLGEMRGRRASAMSGGEQQMLAIARTLVGNPIAVLLDEPSEGLAPVIVEEMARAVERMKAAGVSILLSEQNLSFASAVAGRVAVIERGLIRFEGDAGRLWNDQALREAYLTV